MAAASGVSVTHYEYALHGPPFESPDAYDLADAAFAAKLEAARAYAPMLPDVDEMLSRFGQAAFRESAAWCGAADVPRLRRLNFGARAMIEPLSAEAFAREIAAYDPIDAANVSTLIRATASSDALHEQLLALYERAIEEHAAAPAGWQDESRAAAAFLGRMMHGQAAAESKFNLVIQATHRILDAPVIGRALTRTAKWLVRKGRTPAR